MSEAPPPAPGAGRSALRRSRPEKERETLFRLGRREKRPDDEEHAGNRDPHRHDMRAEGMKVRKGRPEVGGESPDDGDERAAARRAAPEEARDERKEEGRLESPEGDEVDPDADVGGAERKEKRNESHREGCAPGEAEKELRTVGDESLLAEQVLHERGRGVEHEGAHGRKRRGERSHEGEPGPEGRHVVRDQIGNDAVGGLADEFDGEIEDAAREHAEDCFRMGERAADVSMSAYDLLPADERDAIAWVREHGGLDAVKRHWKGYVPAAWLEEAKSRHEQRRDRLKAHAWELECKCAERRETIEELGKTIDDMRPRLMPEGMEWPRFEDGEPVRCGDEAPFGADGTMTVTGVELTGGGHFIIHGRAGGIDRPCQTGYQYGQRVKRPAPKVLDADGVEIRVGDTVYLLPGEWCGKLPLIGCHGGEKMEVMSLSPGHSSGGIACNVHGGPYCYPQHSQLTHRAPVLAADGLPLREGETVYEVGGTGHAYEVASIRIGDGNPLTPTVVTCDEGDGTSEHFLPSALIHERPDSLDRLAEDIGAMVVAWRANRDLFDAQEAAAGCVGENTMGAALDSLMRRAKALAERDA